MDWADDIAYAVHDMEDFYRAGFVPLDRLMDEKSKVVEKFVEGTFRRWAIDFRPVRSHTDEELREAFLNLLEQLRETQQVVEPYTGRPEQRAHLRGLTSLLIRRYVDAISLRQPDRANARTVAILPEAEREITLLKQLTWFYVIQRPSLAGQQYGQRRVIQELFKIFLEATESVPSRDMLPIAAREQLEDALTDGEQDHAALKARVAADVVCSLSEQQAIALYQRFTGVDPGSVLYGIVP
jgi:dGTPase